MTFVLLALCIVVAAVAHRRQARRIDALEERIAALIEPRIFAPAVGVERSRDRVEGSEDVSTALGTSGRSAPDPRPVQVIPPDPVPASAVFEQLVGGRLPIWVGGAALAIAGYFLVRLAIESGLLTPAVRVLLAALFGLALLAAGEGAARLRWIAGDARVTQALSGAGIATLYAAIYLAGSHYALIGPVASFVLLAAITLAALALSLRRGAPVAVMALVGGFATPLLAGSHGQAVLPLIAYLGLLSAGLFYLSIARGWLWLALTAAAGSLIWSGALIATTPPGDALAAGAFAMLLAVAATLTVGASGEARASGLLRALPLVAGAAELAILVASTGFGGEAWSLYLLLSAASLFLAWRKPGLTPAVAAALALWAVALGASALHGSVGIAVGAAIGGAALFGGAGHALGRRAGDGAWWAGIGASGLALPLLILWAARPALMPDPAWSLVALLCAGPPLHLAWRGRQVARAAAPFDLSLQIAAGAAAGFLGYALWLLLSSWMPHDALLPAPLAILAGGVALAEAQRRLDDGGVRRVAMGAAALAVTVMLAAAAPLLMTLAATLVGEWQILPRLPGTLHALLGALLPAGLIALIVRRTDTTGTRVGQLLLGAAAAAAAIGLYLLWKQLFGIRSLPDFVAYGFLERLLLTQALFAAGWAASTRGLPWARIARALTIVAALRVLWLDLVVFNPAFVAQAVGGWPIVNLVTLHFLAATIWIERAWRAEPGGRDRTLALAALVVVAAGGALLVVRQAFHGSLLVAGPVDRAEFYGYSAGGVLLAVALFTRGAALRDRPLRIAGLGLLTLMVLKVFLVDAAALGGLLRIASFLGLGVTLIAIGWAYGRLLGRATAGPAAG